MTKPFARGTRCFAKVNTEAINGNMATLAVLGDPTTTHSTPANLSATIGFVNYPSGITPAVNSIGYLDLTVEAPAGNDGMVTVSPRNTLPGVATPTWTIPGIFLIEFTPGMTLPWEAAAGSGAATPATETVGA